MTSLARARFVETCFAVTFLALGWSGCSSPASDDDSSGSQATGGVSAIGGASASGGSGGTLATGGAGPASGGGGGASSGGASSGGTGGTSTFALTSTNLTEGGAFADKYTCAEAGLNGSLSPALTWTAGPEGTKSYAITFIDVDLTQGQTPSDLGYHWVIYDIPASVLSLPEALMDASTVGAKQSGAYLGPCPNWNTPPNPDTHTYVFKIYALDTETLTLTPTTGTAAVKDAEAKLDASHLASTTLSGTSDAAP